ncbi:MAG TPA: membrane protein insertion efficiency factor YidD [Bacteroidota bacterium]|nr:membrane protein insertion efficiency factor YidD [Bacteroidota bacterium]
MSRLIIVIVRLYQRFISVQLPFNHCRFYPSCSQYSIEAIEKHGPVKGIGLSLKRISHCHPYSKYGGYDPVP